jgi:hypothetical protein
MLKKVLLIGCLLRRCTMQYDYELQRNLNSIMYAAVDAHADPFSNPA